MLGERVRVVLETERGTVSYDWQTQRQANVLVTLHSRLLLVFGHAESWTRIRVELVKDKRE